MAMMQVPVGFELQLFAAEPDVVNPIYMNWDERGRLWVIETVDYPNVVRETPEGGDDRIKILGRGEIKAKLEVKAHRFSASAKKAIEAAGGNAVTIGV